MEIKYTITWETYSGGVEIRHYSLSSRELEDILVREAKEYGSFESGCEALSMEVDSINM